MYLNLLVWSPATTEKTVKLLGMDCSSVSVITDLYDTNISLPRVFTYVSKRTYLASR